MVLAPGSGPVEPSTRRYDEWREAIRHDFVALDMAPDRRLGAFTGTVRSRTLGHLQVSEVRSVPQTYRRTSSLAGRDGHEFLQVGMLARGAASLEQDGRRTTLYPGQLAVYETGRPFQWSMCGDWELHVFTWPRERVDLSPAESATATARRLGAATGLDGIVGGVLRSLVATPPSLSPAGADRVADEVGGLVATLATELTPDRGPAGGDPAGRDLRARIERYIDEHLSDPDLGPASLARAHFVSERQLHRLFAGTAESVTRRVRRARMDHARHELADARHDTSVTEIARRCGFADPTSFSRAFRAAHGVPPSAYRAGTPDPGALPHCADAVAGSPASRTRSAVARAQRPVVTTPSTTISSPHPSITSQAGAPRR